jgi:hypothetical protein
MTAALLFHDVGATLTLSTGVTYLFPPGRWRPKVARLVDPDCALGATLHGASDDGFWHVLFYRGQVFAQISRQEYETLGPIIIEACVKHLQVDTEAVRLNLAIGMELDDALYD